MVGRELSGGFPAPAGVAGDVRLRLEGLHAGPVRDASIELRDGEIVALVGLVGSGRTELARAIYGALPIARGRMRLDGRDYAPRAPADAIRAGIGLLPEDRKGQGLVLMAAVRPNATLASVERYARRGVIDRTRESAAVEQWRERLRIRTPSLERPVRQLSGGNQQKVVLARWMLAESRILLFDEPTRGIDVGAKAEIYGLMRDLADRGRAILMISSELPEALGMADRVVVMRHGRVVTTLSRADADPAYVASLILGERVAA
jgi:ABC-type sugar transport system ATPase subunit